MSWRDWFQKSKPELPDESEPEAFSKTIRVIGSRSSGKTVYLAALARWPNADPEKSLVQSVTAISLDGERLIAKAKNLLEEGESLGGTMAAAVDDVPDYSFRILLKDKLSLRSVGSRLIALNISCKDYSGEFFDDILFKPGDALLDDYLDDCLQAEGLMLLFDGLGQRQDAARANGVETFLRAIDRATIANNERRIAFVLTKCEQPELWVNRHDPYKIAKARYPKVCQKLQEWERLGSGNLEYFATSAFGMLGDRYPEPNMKVMARDRGGLRDSVLKSPKHWKPFGLVAPVYWLCTGKRNQQLEQE